MLHVAIRLLSWKVIQETTQRPTLKLFERLRPDELLERAGVWPKRCAKSGN